MRSLRPDKNVCVRKIDIPSGKRKLPALVLSPKEAPARLTNFAGLPPAYTFVGDGEPFYDETVRYIEQLRACGVPACVDVYRSNMHAFDMIRPEEAMSREAARRFHAQFAYAQTHYFVPQTGGQTRETGN